MLFALCRLLFPHNLPGWGCRVSSNKWACGYTLIGIRLYTVFIAKPDPRIIYRYVMTHYKIALYTKNFWHSQEIARLLSNINVKNQGEKEYASWLSRFAGQVEFAEEIKEKPIDKAKMYSDNRIKAESLGQVSWIRLNAVFVGK